MTTIAPPQLDLAQALQEFVDYRHKHLKGDEKGEAQMFCDRLFRAFGHEGVAEAGATLEYRIKKANNRGATFADLMWKPRCLIEMKKAGEDPSKHFRQALDYWTRAVPDRPRYVVLCNFDEFHIYDFERQVDEPVDVIPLTDLPRRHEAMAFLLPTEQKPVFENDLEAVSREAAGQMGKLFRQLHGRGIDRVEAQRFVLQCVVAMFSEDVGLLPHAIFRRQLEDASSPDEAYDYILGLFRQMNTPGIPKAGRYKDVQYFNGGLFAHTPDFVLLDEELEVLRAAARTIWSEVRPEIFGTLFEGSMDKGERHAHGAHFTNQVDIMRIVQPTIVDPWRKRIDEASTIAEIHQVLQDMSVFKVLDPACGSGNFLYVAYREMRRLEAAAIEKLNERRRTKNVEQQGQFHYVATSNFMGMDVNSFAVEVAKVTMMIATKLATDELHDLYEVLPLESMDDAIRCADALFTPWPEADVIIGNPPYIGRRKIVAELGAAYSSMLPKVHPAVSGVSDFVCYWFPLAHDRLKAGGRAGFVATNTIRQNESRVSSLDYLVDHGGTIFEAVDSQPWSGDAAVHVSIVNWIKGEWDQPRVLWLNEGDLRLETDQIHSSLKATIDVRQAGKLTANTKPKRIFQGQTPGDAKGFVINQAARDELIAAGEGAVIHEWIAGGTDLINGKPRSYVIDIPEDDLTLATTRYPKTMQRLREMVMGPRLADAARQAQENAAILASNPRARVNTDKIGRAEYWWRHHRRRAEMIAAFEDLDHYLGIGRVTTPTRRMIVVPVPTHVRPGDLVSVVALDDTYSFGVVSSSIHKAWLDVRCSTLGVANRYTSSTVWDTFPWPQAPTAAHIDAVEAAAQKVLDVRQELLEAGSTLEQMYNAIRVEGRSTLRSAHEILDAAVLNAYGFDPEADIVEQLFALNRTIAADEVVARGPGRPVPAA